MCQDCGCSIVEEVTIHSHDLDRNSPPHHHHHHHSHVYDGEKNGQRTLEISQSILSKNDRLAERNRGYFRAKGLLVLNILSSPGSGKTALIERTIADLQARWRIGVIVGDLETDNDAQRLRQTGAPAIQITTGTACHLEAEMVARAAQQLDLERLDLLIVENVGNLVCPAAYDLGEDLRVVLLSVTEGEDKPLKYPTTFKSAQVIIINKIDIAQAVDFDRQKALTNIARVAPQAKILEVSARQGTGMGSWSEYLEAYLHSDRLSSLTYH
jgi:hydrogenase nickel incorporation protein HypB